MIGLNEHITKLALEIKRHQKMLSNLHQLRVQLKGQGETRYSHVRFSHAPSRPKLLLMVQLLEKAHRLLITESTVTQRELYYQLLLPNESVLRVALSSLCSVLGVAPWELGILATSKGLVAGSLVIHTPSEVLDCSTRGGILVPSNVAQVTTLESDAKFVLLVEKDAIFQKLLDEDILDHLGPLILLTGKGFPDVATRQLLRTIWDCLQLPVLALVDADPHGIEIMCVYRFGSLNKAEFPELAVPTVRWVGVHPTDISLLDFPESCLSPLSVNDKKKAAQLLQRPFINQCPQLKQQVEEILRLDKKAEIEAVGNFANAYLTDVFIPFKISNKEFL